MAQPNAADRKSVRQLEKAARFAEAERHAVLANLMSTAPGRAWVHELLSAAHVFHGILPTDALRMAYAEGERNSGLKLLTDLMAACPALYLPMMEEANARDSRANDDNSRQRPADDLDEGRSAAYDEYDSASADEDDRELAYGT